MRLAWWLYLPGLLAFAAGLSSGVAPLLVLGGLLLYGGFGIFVAVVVGTLRRTRQRDVVFWHVVVAQAGLVAGLHLALLLALARPGRLLGGATLQVLAAHATMMVGGWVLPTLTGVGYRLVGMFALAEDEIRPDWARAELALVAGGAWTLAAGLLLGLGRIVDLAGALALLAGLVLFAVQVGRLHRRRRRRPLDVHMPFLLVALAFGVLAAGLVAFGLAAGRTASDPLWLAAGWSVIVGCAETAIQGFLYKIGPFLAWLHRYAPLAGRRPVPRLEDLYQRRTALLGWVLWSSGVGLGGAAALTADPGLAAAAAAGLSLGLGAFLLNALRVGWHALGRAGRGAAALDASG
jgi:hypothetical protein